MAMGKTQILEEFYRASLSGEVEPVAPVFTSGSYARKVRTLARLGKRSDAECDQICTLVEHLRASFKIMDDLLDEDDIRDFKPAFWTLYGEQATVTQGAWHVSQARALARTLACTTFEDRLCEVIEAVRLELSLEGSPASENQQNLGDLWLRIVNKEASFRRFLAEALLCPPSVCDAAYQDGIAAQILDDARATLYGKDGRRENSDERLGRLTYMLAFRCSAQEAEHLGLQRKETARALLRPLQPPGDGDQYLSPANVLSQYSHDGE